MTKTVFAYVLIIIFVGLGVWLFTRHPDADVDLLLRPVPDGTSAQRENNFGTGTIKMENGLQIQDLKVGTGPEVRLGQGLTMHYSGTLEDGTKFDSSYDRGEPFKFVLGAGQVIKGWDLGVQGMRVGGKRKLIIPPALGYGEKGIGPIPSNATLIFEVEVLAAQDIQK